MAQLKPELRSRLDELVAKAYFEYGLDEADGNELDGLIALANLAEKEDEMLHYKEEVGYCSYEFKPYNLSQGGLERTTVLRDCIGRPLLFEQRLDIFGEKQVTFRQVARFDPLDGIIFDS